MSQRKYTHIKVLEPEIVEMKESGKTKREIAEHSIHVSLNVKVRTIRITGGPFSFHVPTCILTRFYHSFTLISGKEQDKMLEAIHAQESKKSASEKVKAVVAELKAMKLRETASKVRALV